MERVVESDENVIMALRRRNAIASVSVLNVCMYECMYVFLMMPILLQRKRSFYMQKFSTFIHIYYTVCEDLIFMYLIRKRRQMY